MLRGPRWKLRSCSSTVTRPRVGARRAHDPVSLTDDAAHTLTYLCEAVIRVTEVAVDNSLIAAEAMSGGDGFEMKSINHERARKIRREFGRP